jgi:hypothetical protein
MRDHILANNYLIIDDFISPGRASALYAQFRSDAEAFPDAFVRDEQCPKSQSMYNYRWFLELLIEKIPFISEVMQEQMLPTYSYARIYRHGEVLKKHVDRAACEVSLTLHLGGDGSNWDIFLTRPDGEVAQISLKPGQAIIYLGCLSAHWREAFTGEHYGQAFLHYVKSRSDNWHWFFDKQRH